MSPRFLCVPKHVCPRKHQMICDENSRSPETDAPIRVGHVDRTRELAQLTAPWTEFIITRLGR